MAKSERNKKNTENAKQLQSSIESVVEREMLLTVIKTKIFCCVWLTCKRMGPVRRVWASSHCSGIHRHLWHCRCTIAWRAWLEASTTSQTFGHPDVKLLDDLQLNERAPWSRMWLERPTAADIMQMLSRTLQWEKKEKSKLNEWTQCNAMYKKLRKIL